MDFYPHTFSAPVVEHDVGSDRYRYTVLWIPQEVAAALPLADYPRLRIVGEIDGHLHKAALTPVRGRHYILLSAKLLKRLDKTVGMDVHVAFRMDDQRAVDIPPALRTALDDMPDMMALWSDLTPGKQRSLAYLVASAKTQPTQAKRVERIFGILAGELDLNGRPL